MFLYLTRRVPCFLRWRLSILLQILCWPALTHLTACVFFSLIVYVCWKWLIFWGRNLLWLHVTVSLVAFSWKYVWGGLSPGFWLIWGMNSLILISISKAPLPPRFLLTRPQWGTAKIRRRLAECLSGQGRAGRGGAGAGTLLLFLIFKKQLSFVSMI